MKQQSLRPVFVEYIPEQIHDGALYISQRYQTATHKCCCGCGQEVVTPIGPTNWALRMERGAVTLDPSIGNWSLPCRSHYWIRDGKVVWAAPMSRQQIERGRAYDQRSRDLYIAEVNREKEQKERLPAHDAANVRQSENRVTSTWQRFRKWLGFDE